MGCKIIPYDKDRKYDPALELVMSGIRRGLSSGNDDHLEMVIGTKGSGKSMFMLHQMEYFLGQEADVKYLGLRKGDFANALHHAKNKPRPRFCGNDEANINKRNALTKYNKDIMDLYFAIRGLNIFHVWCNPSLQMIDKHFIEEVMKGVVFICSKHSKVRFYYYFTKEGLLRLYEKYKRLDLKMLKRVSGEYAFYRGWFKDYDGFLLQDYLEKKENRMEEKVNEFHKKYGAMDKLLKPTDIARRLLIPSKTFYRREKILLEAGELKDKYALNGVGNRLYTEEMVDFFRERLLSMKNETKS